MVPSTHGDTDPTQADTLNPKFTQACLGRNPPTHKRQSADKLFNDEQLKHREWFYFLADRPYRHR